MAKAQPGGLAAHMARAVARGLVWASCAALVGCGGGDADGGEAPTPAAQGASSPATGSGTGSGAGSGTGSEAGSGQAPVTQDTTGQVAAGPGAPASAAAASLGQALPTATAVQQTGRTLDAAIDGEGAFVLRDPVTGNQVLSRLGQFDVDAQGRLINSEGWLLAGLSSGQYLSTLAALETLPPIRFLHPPAATSKGWVEFNLDARQSVVDGLCCGTVFDPYDARTYNNATSLNVYDIRGMEVSLTIFFQKVGDDLWNVYGMANAFPVSLADAGASQLLATLQYPANGSAPINPADPLLPLPPIRISVPSTLNYIGARTEAIAAMDLDLSRSVQYGTVFSVFGAGQDGYAAGQLEGVSLLATGQLVLTYANGQHDTSRRLVLARPTVADRLQRFGQTGWLCGPGCHAPLVALPGEMLTGALLPGALSTSY